MHTAENLSPLFICVPTPCTQTPIVPQGFMALCSAFFFWKDTPFILHVCNQIFLSLTAFKSMVSSWVWLHAGVQFHTQHISLYKSDKEFLHTWMVKRICACSSVSKWDRLTYWYLNRFMHKFADSRMCVRFSLFYLNGMALQRIWFS